MLFFQILCQPLFAFKSYHLSQPPLLHFPFPCASVCLILHFLTSFLSHSLSLVNLVLSTFILDPVPASSSSFPLSLPSNMTDSLVSIFRVIKVPDRDPRYTDSLKPMVKLAGWSRWSPVTHHNCFNHHSLCFIRKNPNERVGSP